MLHPYNVVEGRFRFLPLFALGVRWPVGRRAHGGGGGGGGGHMGGSFQGRVWGTEAPQPSGRG